MDRSEAIDRLRILATYAEAATFDRYVRVNLSPKDKLALEYAIGDMTQRKEIEDTCKNVESKRGF